MDRHKGGADLDARDKVVFGAPPRAIVDFAIVVQEGFRAVRQGALDGVVEDGHERQIQAKQEAQEAFSLAG